jgi:hypothetical protein
MYKSFAHNYLQMMGTLGFKEKDAAATLYGLLSVGAIAGPGAVFGAKAWLWAGSALAGLVPGYEPPDDPEEAIYQWVGSNMGWMPERAARGGLAGLAGINIKHSMEIGISDIPTTPMEILGAPGSIFVDLKDSAVAIKRGDVWKGAEKIMPRFIQRPMQAYREFNEGVTTSSNAPVFYGNLQIRGDMWDSFIRTVGLNPIGISELRERQWSELQTAEKYSKQKADIYARMRRWYLKPSRTQAQWIELLDEANRWNNRVVYHDHNFPLITTSEIRNAIKTMTTPPKHERERGMGQTRELPNLGRVAPAL